jgi:hypothetical protein
MGCNVQKACPPVIEIIVSVKTDSSRDESVECVPQLVFDGKEESMLRKRLVSRTEFVKSLVQSKIETGACPAEGVNGRVVGDEFRLPDFVHHKPHTRVKDCLPSEKGSNVEDQFSGKASKYRHRDVGSKRAAV